jgi:hypothetical protein
VVRHDAGVLRTELSARTRDEGIAGNASGQR